MIKKPNLSTVEAVLSHKDSYVMPSGSIIRLSRSGFFTVSKDGKSRIYQRLVDAWKAACVVILMLSGIVTSAQAQKTAGIPVKTAFVDAIIGEAENNPESMLWVACVIRNRNNGLRGIYGANSPRVKKHLYSPKTFVQAVKAYEESAKKDVTGGCLYWFSDNDLKMAKVQRIIRLEKLVKIRRIAGNNFYRKG